MPELTSPPQHPEVMEDVEGGRLLPPAPGVPAPLSRFVYSDNTVFSSSLAGRSLKALLPFFAVPVLLHEVHLT